MRIFVSIKSKYAAVIKILIEMKKKGWWKLFVYCNIYFDIIDIIV